MFLWKPKGINRPIDWCCKLNHHQCSNQSGASPSASVEASMPVMKTKSFIQYIYIYLHVDMNIHLCIHTRCHAGEQIRKRGTVGGILGPHFLSLFGSPQEQSSQGASRIEMECNWRGAALAYFIGNSLTYGVHGSKF